jgi:AcrR family transcriptional regulator
MSYNYVKDKEVTADSGQVPARRRRQRPEARRSIAAILEAATETLNANPAASIEDIARAAGVTRQTVYAHFPSRDALLDAIIERAAAEVTAALDAAQIEGAPPAAGLVALLEAGWQVTARYPFVWNLPAVTPEQDTSRHAPVLDHMLDLIRRGQQNGDLDATLSPEWLLTASLAIGRAAQEEVKAGRMHIEEASRAVHHSFLCLLGLGPAATSLQLQPRQSCHLGVSDPHAGECQPLLSPW